MSAALRSAATAARPGPPILIGVFLTAMSALLLQIALTRVFAVMMWHHFAYMVVSLALLGFGASGSILTAVRAEERRQGLADRLALFATLYGVAVVLAFLLVTRIPVDTIELLARPVNLLLLMACYVVISIPFLFCGLALGSAIAGYPERVGTVYFWDLAGSALGCVVAPWLLARWRTDAVVVDAALLALLGGLAFAAGSSRARRLVHAAAALAGLGLAVAFAGGAAGIPALQWTVPFAPHKVFVRRYFPDGRSAATLPSPIAQVDVSPSRDMPIRMAADFGALGQQTVEMRGVTQDGSAPTVLYKGAADVARFEALAHSQGATAFIAHQAAGGRDPNVLVIGVGGGPDVVMGLYFGARKVTAVELNQAMIDMVTRDFAGYLGGLFADPRIDLVREDGRAYLKRTRDRYDVIQLSGTDTFTALSSGVYTLSEGYLYTVEAVADMYERLAPGGYVNYSRAILWTPDKPARETLRLANVARAALAQAGVAEPWRHIVVFQGANWASTIIRKGPFTAAEMAALRGFAERERFLGLVFDPLRAPGEPADDGETSLTAMGIRALVPPDAVPNEEEHRLLDGIVRAALRGDRAGSDAAIAALVGDDAEWAQALARTRDAVTPQLADLLAYRRSVLLPSYRTVLTAPEAEREQFVAAYRYDLRPTYDDKPFFFDYFRLGKLREASSPKGAFNEILPEFPVGHAVLAASLVQILLWAALLIFLPLRRVPGAGAGGYRLRFFLYFAALGGGFMFVEIGLMQKLNLYLGHPTYALSVVLAGILAFAGLGALCSARVRQVRRRTAAALLAAAMGLLLVDLLVLDAILGQTIALPLPARVAIAVLLLAPTAFLLGFPFPLGVRLVRELAPGLVPWGWAINGFLSVAGSMLAIVLAMAAGFSAVLFAGMLLYGIALLAVPDAAQRPATGTG